MSATLWLPTGPPGCGKSTLADRLIHTGLLQRDAVVSPDHFRRVLTGDRADQSVNAEVFKLCHAITIGRLARGLDVWFDATNLPTPIDLIERAEAVGAEAVIVEFDVEPDELHRRNACRDHPVPDDVLERFIGLQRARV